MSRISAEALQAIQEASILDAHPLRESLSTEIRALNDLIVRVHVAAQSSEGLRRGDPLAAEVAQIALAWRGHQSPPSGRQARGEGR